MIDQPPGRHEPSRERDGSTALAIQQRIRDLESTDFRLRAESMTELEKLGEPAARAIVSNLLRNPSSHENLSSYSDALEEIGKPSVNVIVHALSDLREVRRPDQAHLIQNLVETLARIGGRRSSRTIVDQLGKLDRAIHRNHNVVLVDCCEAAKVRIHRLLADLGVSDGVDDLIAMLGDGRRRVRAGLVEALERLGDRRALVPLLRLYRREEDVSYSGALTIKGAIREIARRGRVAVEDLKGLTAEERATLEKILPRKH
jgi:HEAT repeat protein